MHVTTYLYLQSGTRIKMFLFTVLLHLVNALQYSSCERFNIVPSPDSPYPGEFTEDPCLNLQQYVANPSSTYSDICSRFISVHDITFIGCSVYIFDSI